MIDTPQEIKSILYYYLEKFSEEKIQTKISQGKSSEFLEEIIFRCYPKIVRLSGNTEEKMGIFAESLMHYLLTNSLIPSQRKIIVDNMEVDIVIPDSKTLLSKPNDSLIIAFAKTADVQQIKHTYHQLKKIQPQKDNIWFVSSQDLDLDCKLYSIKRKESSFSKILDDVNTFTSNKKMKFKIFKT